MFLYNRVLVATLAACLFTFSVLHAGGLTKPVDKGQRVFTAGHSLHHVGGAFMPTLQNVAESAGIKGHAVAGYWPVGNYQQYWKEADDKHKLKQALRDGKVDVLTLVGILRIGSDPGIEEFAKFALKHNPDIRITLQASWLQYDDPKVRTTANVDWNAATGQKLRKDHAEYFKTSADQVRALNKQLGKDVLFLVPVGEATIALREKIIAGQAPGIKKQADLFNDDLGHAREPLKLLAVYCHFAVIYRRSPVGLPMPALLKKANNPDWDEKLNRLLQELAWDTVTKEPLSGVKIEQANDEKDKVNKAMKDAAAKGDIKTVLALIKQGADVQWRDPKDYGKTALTRSVLNGRFDVVKVLLENGADIHYPDGSNRYPVYFSAFGPNAEMLKFLLSKGGDKDLNRPPFILVSLCDHAMGPAELIPILIKAGANPNLQHEKLLTTPLIEAIKQDGINAKRRPERCLAYVRALIENGADVNLKDNKGMSPLQWATLRGNKEIIAILRKAGAKE